MKRHARRVAALALIPILLAGCTALGSRSDDSTAGNGLERTKIRVAILTVADVAPFWLAQDGGFFKAQGLEVEEVPATDPANSVAKLTAKDADIVFMPYTNAFIAKAKGTDVKLVADGVFASAGTNVIVAPPNSPVKRLEDLPGKRVGISSKNAASDILTREVLRAHALDAGSVKFVQVPLPNMGAAMEHGDLDAAFQPEPFLSAVQGPPLNAIRIYDAAKPGDSTDSFPLTGYAALGDWTRQYPKTMAAFQRSMAAATHEAGDRARVESLIVAHAHVQQEIATRMGWPGFVSRLDPRRIQRVPDLLWDQHALPTKDKPDNLAEQMIVPQVAG